MADNVVLNPGAGGAVVSTEDIGGGLQMERTKIVTGAYGIDGGDVTGANPFPVSMGQTVDISNSKAVTLLEASPGSPWVGTWTLTRSLGYVRQLVVLASNVSSGLGGTFTFEYSEDGANAQISESRNIVDFETVRDFDLLNAGAYFRVKFEPSRVLVGAETVFVSSTQRRQNDGHFARLADQEIEQDNAAIGAVFAYLKGFDPDTRKSVNIRPALHKIDTANSTQVPLTNGAQLAVTTDFTTDVFTSVGHGYANGDAVVFTNTGGALPAPLTSSTTTGTPPVTNETVYWIRDAATDTFKVSTSPTGSALNLTDNGTGTHTVQKRGQFLGTFKEVSQVGSLLSLFLSTVKPALVRQEWSNNGTTINTDLFATSAMTPKSIVSGAITFWAALTPSNTLIDAYRRIRVVNGPTDQTAGLSLFTTFVGRESYQGSFGGLEDALSILSTALLTRSVIAGTKPDGSFGNVAIDTNSNLSISEAGALVTSSGSRFSEGIRDDIGYDFGTGSVVASVASLVNVGSVGGAVAADTVNGGVLFSTGATPGNTCIFRSEHAINYANDTGHGIRGDQTIFLDPTSAAITGNAYIEWGFGPEGDGFGYGYDATGFYTWLKKNSVYLFKVYQSSWNGDKCNGSTASQFLLNGQASAIRFDRDNFFMIQGEFLYGAEQTFFIKSPRGRPLLVHTNEYANAFTHTSLRDANLTMFIAVRNDTTSGGNIVVRTGSWRGGIYTSKINLTAKSPNGTFIDQQAPGPHAGNSTTAPLAGNSGGSDHIFRGTWFEWSIGWVAAITSFRADVPGSLFIDLSNEASPVNGSEVSVQLSREIPYSAAELGTLSRRITAQQSRWVRVRYVNGVAAQSSFQLVTSFEIQGFSSSASPLDVLPTDNTLATMSQTVLIARPEDAPTTMRHLRATMRTATSKYGLNAHLTGTDISIRPRAFTKFQNGHLLVGTARVQIPLPTNMTVVDGLKITNTRANTDVFWGGPDCTAESLSDAVLARGGVDLAFGTDDDDGIDVTEMSPIFVIAADQGALTSTANRFPGATASNSGVTNPANLLADDGAVASFDDQGDSINLTTFTPAGALPAIEQVKIQVKARKAASPTTETVAYQETQTGATTGAGTVVSAVLTGGSGQLYVACISRNSATGTITSVTGLGLTWSASVVNVTNGGRRLDVWWAYGTATAGTVTATMSVSTNAHIAVSRYIGADPTTPIEDSDSATGTGTSVTLPAATGTANGMALVSISHESSGTAGAGYTEQSDQANGSGSNVDGLSTETKPLIATGNETGTYTLAVGDAWAAAVVTIRPAPAVNPILKITYQVGVEPVGVTFLQQTLTSTTLATYEADITGDRAWIPADISTLKLILLGQTVGAADIEVDAAWLRVTEIEADVTARVTYSWLGRA